MDWTDDYLRWNPAEYGAIENLVIPADDMWLPDIGLANGLVSAVGDYSHLYLSD